jgi:hypothetical protein
VRSGPIQRYDIRVRYERERERERERKREGEEFKFSKRIVPHTVFDCILHVYRILINNFS